MGRPLWLLALALAACGEGPQAPTLEAMKQPVRDLETPAEPPRFASPRASRLSARHVLVTYAGATRAPDTVGRTKEEAKKRAEEVLSLLQQGADFARVARTYSEDPSANFGGDLGAFERGTMVPPFEAAVDALEVGAVAPSVVETPFGFHVIRREPLREIRAAVITVSHRGAERAPASVTRTQQQAQALAEQARQRLLAGEEWSAVVASTSDGPMKEDAGDLGWFVRGQILPVLDKAAFDLEVGGVSPVLQTARGFHLLRRSE